MRLTVLLSLFALSACNNSIPPTRQALTCSSGETPVYSNRFAPSAGGSGVATGEDAANGAINSESFGGLGPSTIPTPPADQESSGEGSITAMTMACGESICDPGKVAVEIPPAPSYGTSEPLGGPTEGDTLGVGAPLTTSVTLPEPGSVLCVDPPPACPAGQSPQWTSKGEWECTTCDLVVTYGGQYGNYRRCTAAPTIQCPEGEVPTWVFEDEAWECKITCDNGQYDQHTISGELICVPC